MKDVSEIESGAAEIGQPTPQLAVRSDLRAGADADCELGIGYWRRELNYWKDLAQQLGCA
jgi:hypothetical protein